MPGGVADGDARGHGGVALERLEPVPDGAQLAHRTRLRRRTVDEVGPVGRVAAVGGVGEDNGAPLRGPADVVEMEVGEDDVGDVGRFDPLGGETREKPSSLEAVVVDPANPGVDEYDPLAGPARAHQETAHRQLENAVVAQETPVRSPRVLPFAREAEHLGGGDVGDAVRQRDDPERSHPHATPPSLVRPKGRSC